MAVERRDRRTAERRGSATSRAFARVGRTPAIRRGILSVARAHRTALVRRADDVTELVRRRSCLVVAPHPDDETLGCGATMRLKRLAGARVDVVVVSDGRFSHTSRHISADELAARRERESVEACLDLGVTNVRFLRFHERSIAVHRDRIRDEIEVLLRELRPQEVYLPCGTDWLEDHRELRAATVDALRSVGHGTDAYEYPIWYWHPRAWVRDGGARRMSDVVLGPLRDLRSSSPVVVHVAGHLEAKRTALSRYRSQMSRLYDDPDWAVMDPAFLALFTQREELFFRTAVGGHDTTGHAR